MYIVASGPLNQLYKSCHENQIINGTIFRQDYGGKSVKISYKIIKKYRYRSKEVDWPWKNTTAHCENEQTHNTTVH